MKVLVTGATGFIGRHLTQSLIAAGHEVRCLVRPTSDVRVLPSGGVELCEGDVASTESLGKAMSGMDAAYHLAGIRGETDASLESYRAVNVQGTANLLEAAAGAGLSQFIYVSTTGVMGWPRILPANEDTPCRPRGKYHLTKWEGEKLAAACRSLPVTVIRPVMTYGLERSGFVFGLARMIKSGRFIVLGNGRNCLHLVSVQNLVQGMMAVLGNTAASGRTYIIADPDPITLERLATVAGESLGVALPRRRLPAWPVYWGAFLCEIAWAALRRPAAPLTRGKVELLTRHRMYDISRARAELGYRPLLDTEGGIRETIGEYIEAGYL